MLSEFNIDQVALTTEAKKANVKVKFEAAIEKQQRVIEDIRTTDEGRMNNTLRTARGISTALNTTYTRSINTTTLSEFYKIPDVLSEELSYPEEDVEYAKIYSEQLKEKNDQVRISFWETKKNLDDLISSYLRYNDGESETISVTQYCIDEGLTGNDDMVDVCIGHGGGGGGGGGGHPLPPTTAPPIQIDCNSFVQIVCFLEQLVTTNEFIKMDEDMVRQTASRELGKLQDYNDVVNWTFDNQTLDTLKYADHYTCQRNLETYQNNVLVDFNTFVGIVESLSNISSLMDLNAAFTNLQTILDTKLGPYLLASDTEKGWTLESGGGGGGPDDGPGGDNPDSTDGEALKCSWYIEIYDQDVEQFEKGLNSMQTKVRAAHNTLKTSFNAMIEQN